MPRIPTFVAQQRPQGAIPMGGFRPVDFSGVEHAADIAMREYRAEDTEQKRKQEMLQEQQAADEARLHVINASSRVELRAQQQIQDDVDNNRIPGMTERLMSNMDEWAKEEDDGAPSLAKPALAQHVAQLRGRLNEKAFGLETAGRNLKLKQDFSDGLDDDRRVVFADPSRFQETAAARVALANSLTLPDGEKRNLVKTAREGLAFEAATALAERNPDAFLQRAGVAGAKTGKDGKPPPTDPAEAAQRVQSDPILSSMDPAQLRQVIDRATLLKVQRDTAAANEADRKARQAEMFAEKREREANQAYTILTDWARQGIAADPAAAKPLLDKIAGTPYQGAYAAIAQTVPQRAAAALQPPAAQRTRLDALYAERAAKGTSPSLQHEIQQSETILAETNKAFGEDAMRAGANRGLVSMAPIDMSAGLPAIVQQVQARAPAAASLAAHVGRPVSPFTNEEADTLKQQLDALPPKERSQAISSLATTVGATAADGLSRQINRQDRGLGLAFKSAGEKTTNGRFTSELIIKGQQAKSDGTSMKGEKAPDVKEANWKSVITTELGDAYGNQQTLGDVRDAAVLIAHGIASEQGGALSMGDMQRAARLAAGASAIIDHNGRKVPIPAGMDESAFEQRLATVTPAEIVSQSAAPAAVAGQLARGNIDLTKRPTVHNADGSISTVRSMSANFDGQEVLLPTIGEDGKQLTDQQAIDAYRQTGKHLGKFKTPEAATAYAQALHTQQEGAYFVRAAGVPVPVDEFVKSLPGQQLMPTKPGEFAVLVKGRPVTNAAGAPIIIRMR